ncbi:hypothetical protein R3X27_16940 [Tropicimonas sp. TH_r6]|uniref:hypothetical protein n=1 Tax=Tropicimonas sp. TH_r6 TaxID=3082085 RepID=UPI002955874C|nr:hypothetical protein [Tropicimonas sp. TH_r6]MDV7144369.1 hypothetical protein [Tropicimonas sp. TH_r6]
MMKLVLHIGTEKTGSTSIQGWLHDNKARLRDNGVFLSEVLSTPNNRSLVHCFQKEIDEYFLHQGIRTLDERDRVRDEILAGFSSEILSQDASVHTAILTSEHFHSRLTSSEEIGHFLRFARGVFSDIQVICYFRNQLALCRSKYSTAVRAWRSESFEEYLHSNTEMAAYYDLYALAVRWAKAVGKDKVSYRSYDTLREERRDIRRDFMEAAGLDGFSGQMDYTGRSQNMSLSLMDANVLRAINSILPAMKTDGTPSKANRAAKKTVLPLAGGVQRLTGRRSISASRHAEARVRERFADTNEMLFAEFGVDIRMTGSREKTGVGHLTESGV